MSKRIGLLSLSNAENYGAVLQSYSLYRVIKSMDRNVHVINYFPAFMKGRYKLLWIDKSTIRSMVSTFKYSFECLPYTLIKKMRFCVFRMIYLHNAPILKRKSLKDAYDIYIVGSDQVWNTNITNMDMTFFLDFVEDNKKKNTYAASIGVSKYPKSIEDFVLKEIGKFNRISIREKQGKQYIKREKNDLNVLCHIDPVFLTSAEEWKVFCKRNIIREKYILIYSFENLKLAIEIANKICNEKKWKIIIIRTDKNKYYQGIRCYRTAGPRDFLNLISNAEFVITDSFHGTAFSLIFNRDFYSIPYNATNSRIENILSIFNNYDRMISSINEVDLEKKCDYSNYKKILKNEINKSRDYLENILEVET